MPVKRLRCFYRPLIPKLNADRASTTDIPKKNPLGAGAQDSWHPSRQDPLFNWIVDMVSGAESHPLSTFGIRTVLCFGVACFHSF
jgi:hypothetical protein